MAWVRDVMRLEPSGTFFLIIYIFTILFKGTILTIGDIMVRCGRMGGSRCVASRARVRFFFLIHYY